MNRAAALFEFLTEEDIEWILATGSQERIAPNSVLIAASQPLDGVYFVIEGVLGVFADATATRALATLGPADVVGEMSFLEGKPPTESVVALEATSVLSLRWSDIQARSQTDPAFAARMYRGFGNVLSRRLRQANRQGDTRLAALAHQDDLSNASKRVAAAIREFQSAIHEADRAALKNDGLVPETLAAEAARQFEFVCDCLHREIGDSSSLDEATRARIGAHAQAQLLPYILLGESAERIYSKPRGYAGDYLTIQKIYAKQASGTGRIGPLIDQFLLDSPPGRAVRNRRALIAGEVRRIMQERSGDVTSVTSLACGPAEELFDVFADSDAPALKATLIDFDLQALAAVADRRDRLRLQKAITVVNENLIYLSLGRAQTSIRNQDLVYSIGLIDYFDDQLVIKLINLIHSMLRPGGMVILGNFHPANAGKAFMDYVLEWRLLHRSETDMNNLFRKSVFGRPCDEVRLEPEGINLFAACIKE